jgi:single-stranded DNA-binding protein
MNTCIFILKLTEDPNEENYQIKIKLLEIKATFTYFKKDIICTENFNLLVWGNQIDYILQYYRKDDYVVIEGFLTIFSQPDSNTLKVKEKKIEITVLNMYLLFPLI